MRGRSLREEGREPHPPELEPALAPVFSAIRELTDKIKALDALIEKTARKLPKDQPAHPGPRGGDAHRPVLPPYHQDPARFLSPGRSVLSGSASRQAESGSLRPQLRITKAGDDHLRWLLITAAHYILGPFGPDSDLRRWGLALCEKGAKSGKKRAVVAVAPNSRCFCFDCGRQGDLRALKKHEPAGSGPGLRLSRSRRRQGKEDSCRRVKT